MHLQHGPEDTASVVLVGRPNVGKSTLFNRMTGSRRAIVAPDGRHDAGFAARRSRGAARRSICSIPAGCTAPARIRFTSSSSSRGSAHRRRGSLVSSWTAARVSCPGDETIARELRRPSCRSCSPSTRPTTSARRPASLEFYQLGFEPVVEISAEHGQGVGDLLDEIVERLTAQAQGWHGTSHESGGQQRRSARDRDRASPSSAGPNVGKSSLAQSVAEGRARARQRHAGHDARCDRRGADVAPPAVPHRRHGGHAAARAASRSGGQVELVSVARREAGDRRRRRRRAGDRCERGRDRSGCGHRRRSRPAGRGVVIVANKWDLVKSADQEFVEDVRRRSCGGR